MKRKIHKLISRVKQDLFMLAMVVFSGMGYAQTTYTFNYTGSTQTINLLAGNYQIECWGADGGAGGTATALTGTGGIGGYSRGTYAVTSPTTLYIYVGGVGQSTNTTGASIVSAAGGWNGGGGGRNGSSNSYYRGGGGGGTDVRTTQNVIYSDRIIVAGGGGGAGGSSGTPLTWVGSGGNGGGTMGQDGVLAGSQVNHNGKGGTQSAGGTGGIYSTNVGVAGSLGLGGDGGGTSNAFPAGGGGGGYYGGGGGAVQGGAGGGGSSYLGGVTSGTTIMFSQPGFTANADVTGNGMVLITELCSVTLSVAGLNSIGEMCPDQTLTITTNAVSNYSWTDGSTGSSLIVAPTTNTVYGLTATSPSNCTSSAQAIIVISPTPTMNITNNTPVVCLGNQAMFSASGADTYLWSSNATAPNVTVVPTQNTMYSVTGTYTLTNCSSTETVMVDVFTPTVDISGNNIICNGVTSTLVANAAGAISYSWSTGLPLQSIFVSPSNPIVYVATAQVSTLNIICAAINSIQVTVKAIPNIIAVADKSNMCMNESVLISAGGGTAYSWTWGSQTSNAPTITITPSVSANIIVNVTGTAANGCTNTNWVAVIVNACTGIEENTLANNLQVYPNPSHGEIHVNFNSSAELQLINETGQVIRKISLNEENNYRTNISGLSNGIYFITGQNETQSINKKVVVNR